MKKLLLGFILILSCSTVRGQNCSDPFYETKLHEELMKGRIEGYDHAIEFLTLGLTCPHE